MKNHNTIRKTLPHMGAVIGLLTLTAVAATAWPTGEESSTPCPFLFADLGNASAFSVLALDANKVEFSSGAIKGDVGIGPGGLFQISGSSVVGGTLSLSAGATLRRSGSACIANIV